MAGKSHNTDTDTLLNQWQTCVEMADSVSQRRDTMNNIFITLNLAIIAAASFVWNVETVILLGAGIVVCVLWILFIHNYKLLNSAKFSVICELEKKLPYQPFNKEWESLKNSKKYKDNTALEKLLPCAFMFIYVIIAAILLYGRVGGSV